MLRKQSMDGITPFTHRAGDYAQARPQYPVELIQLLKDAVHLEPGSRVADVGSGTGLFSAMLLRTGATVFACEPNPAMRAEAEAQLGSNPGFVSIDSRAEDLPFDDAALDLITCAQSFHWFDREAVQREFSRVLHGAGMAALIWNSTDKEDPFTASFQDVLARGNHTGDKASRPHKEELRSFFLGQGFTYRQIRHEQELPLRGLVPLVRSRSYWPEPESDLAKELESELLKSAEEHQSRQGTVIIRYVCDVHLGHVADPG